MCRRTSRVWKACPPVGVEDLRVFTPYILTHVEALYGNVDIRTLPNGDTLARVNNRAVTHNHWTRDRDGVGGSRNAYRAVDWRAKAKGFAYDRVEERKTIDSVGMGLE
jgi:hypothetical protein